MSYALLTLTSSGLYCPRGDFYIDPWRPVPRALITHAHGDHARWGMGSYTTAQAGVGLLRRRVGETADITGVAPGEELRFGELTVSFHPAGHVLGSSQIRVSDGREVWVCSGDYKRGEDPTCAPFEVVPCDVFITEATFALPIYSWAPGEVTAREILAWWDEGVRRDHACVLFCYALGKAQRILGELARLTDRPVYVHGAIAPSVEVYRETGVHLLPTLKVAETTKGTSFAGQLILAPSSAYGSTWLRRFGDYETAFASGWMRVRGNRRRRGYDRGFVLSDHADWHGLLTTIADTGARKVLATHGFKETLARVCRESGLEAEVLATEFNGETDEGEET